MRKIFYVLMSLFVAFEITAAAMRCSICNKKIRGKYLKSNGKVFCSQKCYSKTRPVCAACKKRCMKGSYKKDGKFYCSKACLETSFPKCALCGKHFKSGVMVKSLTGDKVYCKECGALPKCFACGLPAAEGKKFSDGRFICSECDKSAIYSLDEAENLFKQVRTVMGKKLKWETKHRIHFRLVDLDTLKKASSNFEPGMEMGLFKHNYTINTRTETKYSLFKGKEEKTQKFTSNNRYSIMLLTGLPKQKFIEVCAHELGHDWMEEYYPKIKSLKIKEGWAEYVASRVNALYGQSFMNKRMDMNPNKVYGEGYRFVRDYVKKHGLSGLFQYFRKLERNQ